MQFFIATADYKDAGHDVIGVFTTTANAVNAASEFAPRSRLAQVFRATLDQAGYPRLVWTRPTQDEAGQ
jgi:hypothetical protein